MAGLVVDDVEFELARPALTFTPASLDFGSVRPDAATATRQVTVTNMGNVELEVSSVGIAGAHNADFTVDGGCSNRSLAPASSCTVEVGFATSAIGTRQAELVVNTNLEPSRAALVGTGAPAPTTPPSTPPTSAPVPPTTPPPPPTTGAATCDAGGPGWLSIVGAAVGLVATALLVRLVARARASRRRLRSHSGQVAVLPGAVRSSVRSERPVVAVTMFLDPAEGRFDWTQWRFR